ncbi:MAG: heme-binding protein [Burkholderiales bacterium]|nr:heme-binding protein [Burkholderiales bacterium]MDE2287723.1 heme-binding protein [Burkholderiales bacterium]MDE2610888.1 heme-binding protein [Burkholderiales bacterium]
MQIRSMLTLEDARRMAEAAAAEAIRHQWPVTIAICDDGGHLLWLQRLDGASPISAEIAAGKARTAGVSRRPSKAFEEMVNQGRYAALSMPITALEGGEPVIVDGTCIGAVGVSGVKPGQDAQVAQAGVAALLVSQAKAA